MRSPLPDILLEHARSFRGSPVEPRKAATIVLLRDGDEGLETYLLRRDRNLKFAPAYDVFPGGSIDESDQESLNWSGPDDADWAQKLGCDKDAARELVVAAVRETFEESGVLLASGPDRFWNTPDYVADRRSDRQALEKSEISLARYFASNELVLRSDSLAPWSFWLTPEFEPRRFATWFFVAAMPRGQQVDHVVGEAEHARWVPLANIRKAADDGVVKLLPPTLATCCDLEGLDVASVLETADARLPYRRTGKLVEDNGTYFIEHQTSS